MSNNIINHRLLVQSRIEKSFQSNGLSMKDVKSTEDIFKSLTPDFLGNEKMVDLVPLSKAEQVEALSDGEFEKAHNDGDIHPNHPDWVWVSSANKGRGDWRKINGRAHKAHGEYRDKFNATFKDADEKILQKIVSGEIQGTAHDKQLAKKMLEDRKSGKVKTSEQEYDDASFSDKVAINLKNENPKYSDKSKITFEDNNNGKYKIMYDGEYTKLLISKDKVDEADAKKAGFIKDKKIKNDGSITLKITTNGSGVVKLSNSVNAKWEDVKDEDFGGRIIGVKIDGELGAKTFPYSFDSMKRKKYDLYTFEEAKTEAEKYLNDKKSELTQQAMSDDKSDKKNDKMSGMAVYYKTLAERFDKTGKCESADTLIGVYKNNNPSKNIEAARAFRKYIMNDLNYIDNNDWQKTLNEYKKLRLDANKGGDKDAYKAYDCAYQAVKDRIAKDAKNKDNGSTKKRGDKNEPAIKYSGMTAAQANKTLVGKTIKIGDKTAKIMNAFKSSVGSNNVYLEVVDGDDYLGKYMQISLDAVDSGKTKYDNKYFGTKGQKIEISDEKPDKKEVTKESFKEFLDYMQKNIAKKDSDEFLNKEYMFLFTVPKKYRSTTGNVHNRVAATIKKLSDANNW